jgi:50S ribosomal subunit-associated GTPase HflX
VEVYNKCDLLTLDERRRLQEREPGALFISAAGGAGSGDAPWGIDELRETLASRLALDLQRVTLTFGAADAADRATIARLYRHARVVTHETRDGRIAVVADVPRRLLAHFTSSDTAAPGRIKDPQ